MTDEVLYFSAAWCGPCRVVSKNVARLEGRYPDITFRHIDVDEEASSASRFNVRAVPTLVHLKDGREVGRAVGAKTVDDLARDLAL